MLPFFISVQNEPAFILTARRDVATISQINLYITVIILCRDKDVEANNVSLSVYNSLRTDI